MNWIRIATGIKNDPRLARMADALGVDVSTVVGLVVSTLCELPEHARDGDVSGIPNLALERWAGWSGERETYAFVFRSQMCDDAGVVCGWEKHNGAAMRQADATKLRAKKWRDQRHETEDEPDANAKRTRSVRKTNALRTKNERVPNALRDVTGRSNTASNEAVPERTPKAVYDAGFTTWLEKLGAVNYGRFRKEFAPIFDIPEADRPPALPRDAEFPRIVELYAVAIRGTRAAQFAKPEACAGKATQLAAAAREADPERRLLLARVACGTVEEQRRLEMAA